MLDWFGTLAAGNALPVPAAIQLAEHGFTILPCVVGRENVELLKRAYDNAFASAACDDIRVGSTSTKVSHFVNRGVMFDNLFMFPPLLEACCKVIDGPFKLSSFLARTLRPGAHAQELHVDVPRNSADWPLLSFILMVDDFCHDNGATRFVPGSHRWSETPEESMSDVRGPYEGEVLAFGEAGSLVVFDGSVWHGHTANESNRPRRSVQGAYIPFHGHAATDFAARMQPETRTRLCPLAQTLLALPEIQ